MGAGVATSPHCPGSFSRTGKPAFDPPSSVSGKPSKRCFGVSRAPRRGRSPGGSPLAGPGVPPGTFRSCRFRLRPGLRPDIGLAAASSAALPSLPIRSPSRAPIIFRSGSAGRLRPVSGPPLSRPGFAEAAASAFAWACTPLPLSRRLRQPPSPPLLVPGFLAEPGGSSLRPWPGEASVRFRPVVSDHVAKLPP